VVAAYPAAMSAPRAISILIAALIIAACAHGGGARPTECTLTRHWRMAEDSAIAYFASLSGPDDRFEEITLGVSPNEPAYARELERIAATGRTLERGGDLTISEEIACPPRP